jgi:hypothetical protein
MAPSRRAVRRGFADLSTDDRLAFLADLYEEQGWQVERGTAELTVRRAPGEPSRTVRISDGRASPDADADVVVHTGDAVAGDGPADVSVVDPGDLYERLRYGIDNEASERLTRDYFGDIPAGADASGSAGERGTAGRSSPGSRPAAETGDDEGPPARGRTRRSLLVVAGMALGAGGTLGATRLLSGTGAVDAPGLSSDGVTDPARLAAAHVGHIGDRSYSLNVDHVRRGDTLDVRSAYGLDLALSAERSYLATVSTTGPEAPMLLGEPPASSVFWSNGEVYYVDHAPDADGGVNAFTPPNGFVGTWRYWATLFAFGGVLGSSPERYYADLFAAVPTRLVERADPAGHTGHRVVATNATPVAPLDRVAGGAVSAVDLSALIAESGLVRSLDLTYRATVDGAATRVRRRIDYAGIGQTSVPRPDWTT